MCEAEKDYENYLKKYCNKHGLTIEEGKKQSLVRFAKEYYEQRDNVKIGK